MPAQHLAPAYTPDDPRFPDVEVILTDTNVGSIMGAVTSAMKRSGIVPTPMLTEFRLDVMSAGSFAEALHRVMCWVTVAVPTLDEDD